MTTVLLVEDNKACRASTKRNLERDDLTILEAGTLAEAAAVLKGSNVDIIVWDRELPDGCSDEGAIQAARLNFNGPMIAASSNKEGRQKQMAAGCTHNVESFDLTNFVLSLIDETKPTKADNFYGLWS